VGCIVGQGDSADGAVKDLRSAIHFHIETFGKDAFEDDSSVLHAFLTEIDVPNPH
jgi:hypothetical protein